MTDPIENHESGLDRCKLPRELRELIMVALQRGTDPYDDVLDAIEAHWPSTGPLDTLRELHRYLYPENYPPERRAEGARSQWSADTPEAIALIVSEALVDDPQTSTTQRVEEQDA